MLSQRSSSMDYFDYFLNTPRIQIEYPKFVLIEVFSVFICKYEQLSITFSGIAVLEFL